MHMIICFPQGCVNVNGCPPHIGAKIKWKSTSDDAKASDADELFNVVDVTYTVNRMGHYTAEVSVVPYRASFLTRLLAAHREWWHNPVFPVI